jgi:acyl-CoA thioesterase I
MGVNWRLALGAVAVAAALTGGPARAADGPMPAACNVPAELIADPSRLPHAAKKLRVDRVLKIVALGSSSTLGMGATSADATYPVRLQRALATRLPDARIEVVNKGVSRQSASQMLERIDSDVLAERPNLVIWETGTAEAVRGADVDEFVTALLTGIDRLLSAGIDVVLMDTQYSRTTAQLINFQPYVGAIEQVSGMRDLVLFHRYAVMRYWVEADRFRFADKAPAEARRVADAVYDCLAHLLAITITRAVQPKQ